MMACVNQDVVSPNISESKTMKYKGRISAQTFMLEKSDNLC
jgi:hypothetical protein